jgi:hypothetical protein
MKTKGKKKTSKTIVDRARTKAKRETGSKTYPNCPLANKLAKPFSLADSQRLVALAETMQHYKAERDDLTEKLKGLRDEWEQCHGEDGNKNDAKNIAYEKSQTEDKIDSCKIELSASRDQLEKLIIECAGGTLFEDQQPADATRQTGSRDEAQLVLSADSEKPEGDQ